MTAPQLLENMQARGFTVSAKGERLSVVPSSKITEKIRAALKQHKAELLELLAQAPPLVAPTDDLGENSLEFLRLLRNAGVLIELGKIEGKRALLWEFPPDAPPEWQRHCTQRLEYEAEFIAQRIEFERWHWQQCAGYFGLDGEPAKEPPVGLPYRTWEQFARFQSGVQTADDLRHLAWFVLTARREGGGLDYARFKIAFRIVCELGGRPANSDEVVKWARLALEGEAQ